MSIKQRIDRLWKDAKADDPYCRCGAPEKYVDFYVDHQTAESADHRPLMDGRTSPTELKICQDCGKHVKTTGVVVFRLVDAEGPRREVLAI
jgi:hypothetical protein